MLLWFVPARTAREIQQADRWREFAEVDDELGVWVEGRAWTTGDGPTALFDAAVHWLRERRVLLPGLSTLVRLVAGRREAAVRRLWDTLSGLLTDDQKAGARRAARRPGGQRWSRLDVLRRAPTRVSEPGMSSTLERASAVLGLGLAEVVAGDDDEESA